MTKVIIQLSSLMCEKVPMIAIKPLKLQKN